MKGKIITCLLLVAGMLCSCGIVKTTADEDLFPAVATNVSEAEVVSTHLARHEPLIAACTANPDTVAWLTIPDTGIDAPVVQAEDNDYYLRRDNVGNQDYRGCLFADYEVDFAELSTNMVIYGHTFSDDYTGGFAELANYEDQAWADSHRQIVLSLPDKELVYQVCAVSIVDVDGSDLPISPNLSQPELEALVRYASDNSLISLPQPLNPEQVITLVTCNGIKSQRRIVIAAL